MIQRLSNNLGVYEGEAPTETRQLEVDGYAVIRGVFTADDVQALRREIDSVFASYPPERGRTDEFRRNSPEFAGGSWHCDSGPHIPRPEGVAWDERIPYPVFAIGAHLLLLDCEEADGPTAVAPGSHRSGRLAPPGRKHDPTLTYDGRPPVLLVGRAGDVALFVSDAWHRGTPAAGGRGRYFLQVHYGRRDLAQRVRTTAQVNHVAPEALARARGERQRTILGLHDPAFYDG